MEKRKTPKLSIRNAGYSPDGVPRIEIGINEHMTVEEYFYWNVQGSARAIVAKPEECELNLMVYEIHKAILAKRGASTEFLAKGDEELVRLINVGLLEKNIAEWF